MSNLPKKTKSFAMAEKYLSKIVEITIDRPLGSFHPKWNFKYEVNYGYLKGEMAPDGEELDAYLLKIDKPVEKFTGKVVAIVHRTNDDDDKLVVIPENESITDEEIEESIEFQEKWFKHVIVR